MSVNYGLSGLSKALICGALICCSHVYAEDNREIWKCNSGSYYSAKDEHNLWLVKEGTDSYIKFYDSRISTQYYLHGLERRWDWNSNNFSVRLKPDNSALYFDFSNTEAGETTNAKSRFGCKKIQG